MKLPLLIICLFIVSINAVEELTIRIPDGPEEIWNWEEGRCFLRVQNRFVGVKGRCREIQGDTYCQSKENIRANNECGVGEDCINYVEGYTEYRGDCKGIICKTALYSAFSKQCHGIANGPPFQNQD
jgi:hypothetical protein